MINKQNIRRARAIGSHQSSKMQSDTWLTPIEVIRSLGKFDLDPCTPPSMPWKTAEVRYTELQNGLTQEWFGRVWLNPPYGLQAAKWLEKLKYHGDGVSLIFARTETRMFFDHVWSAADSIFFFEGRLFFCDITGRPAKANAGAPSVLIAYGENNSDAIASSGLKGIHLPVNSQPVVVVGISPCWMAVVRIAIDRLNGKACMEEIYRAVEILAPDKVKKNLNYKAKIRQKLQKGFDKVSRGVYQKTSRHDQ